MRGKHQAGVMEPHQLQGTNIWAKAWKIIRGLLDEILRWKRMFRNEGTANTKSLRQKSWNPKEDPHELTVGGSGGLVAKSCLTLVTTWTAACQAPLSMWFPRQEYWLPFPTLGDLPERDWTHISCVSCTASRFFTAEPLGKPSMAFCNKTKPETEM